jgi:uncharacterized protein YgiM (DUF1202 family)
MRKFLRICLPWLWLLCLLYSLPAHADTDTAYVLVEAGSVLNVRTHPSLGADVVFRMERGETLNVDQLDGNGWAEVSRAGDFGYCRIAYLSENPPADPQPYTATVGKLRVRTLPGGETVRKLHKGEAVAVLGWLHDADGTLWARTADGYVMGAYLAPVEDSEQEVSP